MKKFLGSILVFFLFTFFSSTSYALQIISPPDITITPSIVPPTNTETGSLPIYYGGNSGIGVGPTSPTFIPSPSLLPIGIINPIPIQLPSPSFPTFPQYSLPVFYSNDPYPFYTINNPDIRVSTRVAWQTPSVSLEADNFYMNINGTKYYAKTGNVEVHSDPGNSEYTTLEVTWHEQGVEMRMFMYFSNTNGKWKNYETRTYDGNVNGNWIYYKGFTDKTSPEKNLGSALTLPVASFGSDPDDSRNTSTGTIYFENLRLKPFTNVQTYITSISPKSVKQGDVVTLKGIGFLADPSVNKVYVGNASMPTQFNTVSSDRKTLTFVLSTETRFIINSEYPVYVENSLGKSNALNLKVVSPTRLARISPNPAPIGSIVTLTGSNFGHLKGSVLLSFTNLNGGVVSTVATTAEVVSWQNDRITIVVPDVAANQDYMVEVNGSHGGSFIYTSNRASLRVISKPIVSKITPDNGPVSQTITVTGFGFGATRGNSGVLFSKYGESEILSWEDKKIVAKVPLIKKRGSYSVWIEKRGGTSADKSNSVSYIVTAAQPFITKVSAATFKSSQRITITGMEFTKNIGQVDIYKYVNFSPQFFGRCTINIWSNTSIRCGLPKNIDQNAEYQINVTSDGIQSPPRFIFKGNDSDCSITGCG